MATGLPPRAPFQVCQCTNKVSHRMRLGKRSGARDELPIEQFPRQSGFSYEGPKRAARPAMA